MKKLLVLMVFLGMASLASATLQISVDGVQEPPESFYHLLPSETVILDIWTDDNVYPGYGEGYWALACDPALGTISGGTGVISDVALPAGHVGTIYDGAIAYVPPEDGVWGGLSLGGAVTFIAPGTTIFDEIVFHCEAPGETVVTLYRDIFGEKTIDDQITIHNDVPEPMTMALLGLGGLFLRRRK